MNIYGDTMLVASVETLETKLDYNNDIKCELTQTKLMRVYNH